MEWFKDDIINFVNSRESKRGGFSFAATTPVDLEDTYYGLRILEYFDALSKDNDKIKDYIKSLRMRNNNDKNRIYDFHRIFMISYVSKLLGINDVLVKIKGNMKNFYEVVRDDFSGMKRKSYNDMKNTDYSDKELRDSGLKDVYNEIKNSEVYSKSDNSKGVDYAIKYNIDDLYYILRIESVINETVTLDEDLKVKIVQFLKKLNVDNVVYVSLIYKVVFLFDYFGIRYSDEWAEYVKRSQNRDGGFGFYPDTTSFLENVYYSLMALRQLNKKPDDMKECEAYVIRCKSKNSGFGRQHNTPPTLEYTYYAIESLNMISEMKAE